MPTHAADVSICHNSCMCGRYRLSRRKQFIEGYFETAPWDDWSPRFNIAPTQPVPVIRQNPKEPIRRISPMKWGLIPHWAKNPSVATNAINAKSETAATKPAFHDQFKFRRCLIPADGFYESAKAGTSKHPYCFEVGEGELFAFADCGMGGRVGWAVVTDVCDFDHDAECFDLSRPRQDASDP
jgi:putative SOS response-associated peptidase YedK